MKIMINAGHDATRRADGSVIDSGAVNQEYGVYECDIVKAISEKIAPILEAEGHKVFIMQQDNLCGEGSYSYTYSVCGQANINRMDMIISIHCNSYKNSLANGTECLVYDLGSRAADLADCIQTHIVDRFDTMDRGLKSRHDLAILRETRMPAVLVETAFISNDDDVQILMYQQDEMAEAIAQGIIEYIDEYC